MKIYCIVVYMSVKARQAFHATVSAGLFGVEPHLEKIQNSISAVALMIKDRDGMHALATRDQIYYAYQMGDKLAITATDEALSPQRQRSLFEKISQAKSSQDLDRLINDPEQAVQSKIDLIRASLEETKQVLRDDFEKLMTRDEELKQLISKTDELMTESFKFSRRTTDLKNKTRCPGLFSFFNSIRNLFGGEAYDYDYDPAAQSKL